VPAICFIPVIISAATQSSYRTSPVAADEIRYPVGHPFYLDSGYSDFVGIPE
jgi:hypothetical protein